MIVFVALRPKTYSYLTDDDNNVKKAKGTIKCVIKKIISEAHCLYTAHCVDCTK